MEFNRYQTKITDELKKSLPRHVLDDLIDYINNVEFIKNLIAPESVRGSAKDLTRYTFPNYDDEDDRLIDHNGRIRVNLTNPHILENMDYFRERAIYYDRYKTYTHITPNPNPKSEYGRFWREEVRRFKEGYTRDTDGEWIPGVYYFYLNYSPIFINEKLADSSKEKKRVRGKRKKEFPTTWLGDYLWFHYMERAKDNGSHCKLLKKRGCGFSWKFGAITPHSMYVNPGLPNFHLASDTIYLEGEKGVFSKVISTLDWIAKNTPLPAKKLIDRQMDKKIGVKKDGVESGLLSSVTAISLNDNPDKARGVRGPIIQYEEDGVFPDIIDAWMVNLEAVEDGGIVFGTMCAGGTGGTQGSNFEGSEKMFYNPETYHIYGLENVFDKSVNKERLCGFFWGAYLNRARCYDIENGEPDVIKALLEVLIDREDTRVASNDPKPLEKRKAEQPITPQEAVLRIDGTIFPVGELKELVADYKIDAKKFLSGNMVGELIYNKENEVIFKENNKLYPIRDFPLQTDNRVGAIEIFSEPSSKSQNRYVIGVDTIIDDFNKKGSLGSAFVFDLINDVIVAEYTGRPIRADDFFENVLKLSLFYNAKINYENNLKGLYAYFHKNNKEHFLLNTPKILKDQQLIKSTGLGNRNKGTRAIETVNNWALKLLADWMIEEIEIIVDNQPMMVKKMITIKSAGLIQEAALWTKDINTDRVSAMGMVMIAREDAQKNISIIGNTETHMSIYKDPIWDKF